jgi:hypothetical protein
MQFQKNVELDRPLLADFFRPMYGDCRPEAGGQIPQLADSRHLRPDTNWINSTPRFILSPVG